MRSGEPQEDISVTHSVEQGARAAQQSSNNCLSKEEMPCAFSPVTVARYGCSLCVETGGEDLPLQDWAVAMSSSGIWGPYGHHQGVTSLNVKI